MQHVISGADPVYAVNVLVNEVSIDGNAGDLIDVLEVSIGAVWSVGVYKLNLDYTFCKMDTDLCDVINYCLQCLSFDVEIHNFQKEVINSYMKGYDTFCVAGTGKGKSLTYVLSPLLHDCMKYGKSIKLDQLESIVIVIQPLKSLMRDQVDKLKKHGVKATYVGEDHDYDGMAGETYNYIIASPETANTSKFRDLIDRLKENIKGLFIDESHCIQSL